MISIPWYAQALEEGALLAGQACKQGGGVAPPQEELHRGAEGGAWTILFVLWVLYALCSRCTLQCASRSPLSSQTVYIPQRHAFVFRCLDLWASCWPAFKRVSTKIPGLPSLMVCLCSADGREMGKIVPRMPVPACGDGMQVQQQVRSEPVQEVSSFPLPFAHC